MTGANYGMALFPQHARMLEASGITPEHARARGYVSVDTKVRLEQLGITPSGRNVPGLLVPSLLVDGSTWGYQYRADSPRTHRNGKPVKYETPVKQRNGLDVPPGVGPKLGDPAVPLWVTEGIKKADAAALAGLACVALPGVWSWRGANGNGGKTAIPDWHDVALNGRRVIIAFDSDVTSKRPVRSALNELAGYLSSKGAHVDYCHLPDDDPGKTGLDDYLAAGHDGADLLKLVRPEPPAIVETIVSAEQEPMVLTPEPRRSDPPPVDLTTALATFRRWLHLPDVDPLLAIAAAAAANRSDDASPVWLLVIGPPSAGKTEQITGLTDLPESVLAATVTESALLSGTSSKERAANATGGLLRQIGGHGLIVMKDFTSVLAQNRDARGAALSALREVYDGSWDRPVGTDGGKVLRWRGKVGVIAGCTGAYDKHHSVISQLGDRFLLVRLAGDDHDPDAAALSIGMSALTHSEDEQVERRMRRELAGALAGLVAGANHARTHRGLEYAEKLEIIRLARYAGVSRTPVDRDGYTGDLLSMPAPEGPGRLTIAFRQVLGGLEAIGVDPETSWRIVRRLAVDTAPALRTSVLRVIAGGQVPTRTSVIARSAGIVTKAAARVLDDLSLIGLANHTKEGTANNSPDLWSPTDLLLRLWPESKTEMYVPPNRVGVDVVASVTHLVRGQGVGGTSLSYCLDCGEPLDPELFAADGIQYHPTCGAP
jgi:Domain of unknown function (DUF3854)